jgi:hypothetical protein
MPAAPFGRADFPCVGAKCPALAQDAFTLPSLAPATPAHRRLAMPRCWSRAAGVRRRRADDAVFVSLVRAVSRPDARPRRARLSEAALWARLRALARA